MPGQRKGCLPTCLRFLAAFGSREPEPSLPKMMINKKFITASEKNFFMVLRHVLSDRGHVLAQISLAQLIYLPGTNNSNQGRATWWNKLSRRSVDFLICDPDTLRPLVAIELDEPSHAKPKRQQRDDKVDKALRAAGLPLLRVLAGRSYNTKEIADCIAPYIGGRAMNKH